MRSSLKRLTTTLILTAATPAVWSQGVTLDTDEKRHSYAVGMEIAQSLLRQGVDIDVTAFTLAVRDAVDGTPPRLSREEYVAALKTTKKTSGDEFRQQAKDNLKVGKEFLAKNKEVEGVVELSGGLQYQVLREGAGSFPKATSVVKVHYVGTLIDGREFDSSRARGEPAEFPLNGVIKGWTEALQLMREGSRWRVFIPPNLGYGVKGAGRAIGPNETLIFEIELLEIVKS
jgi:FKBP-type peptidyl-prolyl cis-trans isomerase FklB